MVGIDPDRVYFREDIADLWGYQWRPSVAEGMSSRDRCDLEEAEADRLRKWFQRNFKAKGLRIARLGNRDLVDGRELVEFVRRHARFDSE